MTDDSKHIDYLIARSLSGEASPEERSIVEQWCKESAENARYFDGMQQLFERAASLETDPQFDVDAAWLKIAPQIRQSKRIKMQPKRWQPWVAAAASVAILIGVWLGLEYRSSVRQDRQPMVIAATATTQTTQLPDSSKVEIEPNSKILYAKGFGKTNRDVTLVGNATFEVKHQTGPAFTVKASGTFIRDIGTAFRVETTKDTTIVEVYVKTGSVVFYTDNNRGIILKQGETGVYNKKTKEFTKIEAEKEEAPPAVVRAFNFQGTSLNEVVTLLSKAYNVTITLGNPKLGSCTINVRFENENIDTILSIIAETLNLKVEKRGKSYVLTGEECSK